MTRAREPVVRERWIAVVAGGPCGCLLGMLLAAVPGEKFWEMWNLMGAAVGAIGTVGGLLYVLRPRPER
jgi:hypothetical protein